MKLEMLIQFVPNIWIKVVDPLYNKTYIGRTKFSAFSRINTIADDGEIRTFENWQQLTSVNIVSALKIKQSKNVGIDYSMQILTQLNQSNNEQ